jgi:hypothetical protein
MHEWMDVKTNDVCNNLIYFHFHAHLSCFVYTLYKFFIRYISKHGQLSTDQYQRNKNIFVDRCLSFCTFSFDHCVVCSSSIYGF